MRASAEGRVLNGRGPYRLLIDLGANVTLLRRDVVDASGSRVLVARATSDIVRVGSMRIGGALFKDVTVGSYRELDADGVIGYNLLRYSSFALDFRANRFAFNHRQLPRPDGVSVFAYSVISNTPFVVIWLGSDSLNVNLDTGAAKWMTIPPRLQSDLHWTAPPMPGRTTHNNQTGDTQVLEGHLRDTVRLGTLRLPSPVVYINSSADYPWLGAAAMQGLVWTFDPTQHRLEVRAKSSVRGYE